MLNGSVLSVDHKYVTAIFSPLVICRVVFLLLPNVPLEVAS